MSAEHRVTRIQAIGFMVLYSLVMLCSGAVLGAALTDSYWGLAAIGAILLVVALTVIKYYIVDQSSDAFTELKELKEKYRQSEKLRDRQHCSYKAISNGISALNENTCQLTAMQPCDKAFDNGIKIALRPLENQLGTMFDSSCGKLCVFIEALYVESSDGQKSTIVFGRDELGLSTALDNTIPEYHGKCAPFYTADVFTIQTVSFDTSNHISNAIISSLPSVCGTGSDGCLVIASDKPLVLSEELRHLVEIYS